MDYSTITVADLLVSDAALDALAEAMQGWQRAGRSAARQALAAAAAALVVDEA